MSTIIKKLAGRSHQATCARVFWALFLVVVCHMLLFFCLGDIRRIVSLVPDDCGYYFKVAENIISGNGQSFDGLNPTNGFHPLWIWVLLPVIAIYHGPPETMCRVYLVLQVVLLTLSALVMYSVHSKLFPKSVCLVAGILFFGLVFVPSANGMESALLVLMLALLYAFALKGGMFKRPGGARSLAFGAILGLCVLARLDTIFVAVAIGGFCLLKAVKRSSTRRADVVQLLMISAGCLIVVGPYLLYNKLAFGAFMPISGALKSSFPNISLSGYALSRLNPRYRVMLLLALVYLLWFIIRLRRLKQAPPALRHFRLSMAIMSVAVLLHFAHAFLFMKWAVFRWHFISYAVFATTAIAEPTLRVVSASWMRTRKVSYWLGVIVLIGLGSCVVVARLNRSLADNWQVVTYDAALWARRNTEPAHVFAMKDAGVFGYYSRRSVVNLDGVMNNMEYQDALRARRLRQYLRKNKVRYLVQPAFPGREDMTSGDYETFVMEYASRKYPPSSDQIVLSKAGEVYRSRPYQFSDLCRTVFIIWKLSGQVRISCCSEGRRA